MKDFAIGTLPFMSNGVASSGYILQTPVEGLDGPDIRTTAFSRPGADGMIVSNQLYDGRTLKLVGKVLGTSFEEFEANRRALIAAVAIQRDSNGYPVPVRVSFTTMAGASFYVDVHFGKPIMDWQNPVDGDFMLVGTAPSPFIFGATPVVSGNISRPTGGGYAVPMAVPYISMASTGGVVDLNNVGNATAMPIITLTGNLTHPILTNRTTGERLELDYTVPSGSEVVIDMAEPSILLDDSLSLIAAKTNSSDWWGLEPGINSIALDTASASDGGYASLSFNPPYTGV
ncbi:hypothetical protein AB0H71_28855 [Nocardia sp. NPDC050697]|uniref:phage distal tail protein n=1 Tax=Nocardia sp. NPDC050697 TaxID=3155158 RepID=UPI0033DC44F2